MIATSAALGAFVARQILITEDLVIDLWTAVVRSAALGRICLLRIFARILVEPMHHAFVARSRGSGCSVLVRSRSQQTQTKGHFCRLRKISCK